jgi:hypothetical protein
LLLIDRFGINTGISVLLKFKEYRSMLMVTQLYWTFGWTSRTFSLKMSRVLICLLRSRERSPSPRRWTDKFMMGMQFRLQNNAALFTTKIKIVAPLSVSLFQILLLITIFFIFRDFEITGIMIKRICLGKLVTSKLDNNYD